MSASRPLIVYSGQCRMCNVGLETPLKTHFGEPLRTGDIVLIGKYEQPDSHLNDRLTVVLCEQYQSYHDGSFTESDPHTPYVMGIKSAPLDEWAVVRVKKFEDVVAGEHWPEWGFSFQESQS